MRATLCAGYPAPVTIEPGSPKRSARRLACVLLLALLLLALVAGAAGHAALHAGEEASPDGGHCTACHVTPFEFEGETPRARAADLVGIALAPPQRGPSSSSPLSRAAPRAPPRVG